MRSFGWVGRPHAGNKLKQGGGLGGRLGGTLEAAVGDGYLAARVILRHVSCSMCLTHIGSAASQLLAHSSSAVGLVGLCGLTSHVLRLCHVQVRAEAAEGKH